LGGRVTDLGAKIAFGNTDDISTSDVPFLRQLRSTTADWLDRDRYYKFRREVREAVEAVEVGAETREPVSDEIRLMARLEGALNIADDVVSNTKKQIRTLNANSHMDDARRRDLKDRAYARRRKQMMRFNRLFVQQMGAQGE